MLDKINNLQKFIILILILNIFLFPFYDNISGLNNEEEKMVWLGVTIVCGVGIFLFQNIRFFLTKRS